MLYNIKIIIFALEIKTDSARRGSFYGMFNFKTNENVERKSWRNSRKDLERTE